ncbi:MAG: DUF362 domain-containing protein [Verrucomicrobiales bacterium]
MNATAHMNATAYKLLPVIISDRCEGCAKCVQACSHACLEMDWGLAKVVDTGECVSEGACVGACPHGGIAMEWRPQWQETAPGDRAVGLWRDDAPQEAVPVHAGFWPMNLFMRS